MAAPAPAALSDLLAMWELRLGRPLSQGRHFVAEAHSPRWGEVVVKLRKPDQEFHREVRALRHYDGKGCVRLYEVAPQQGGLLLERLQPGQVLRGHAEVAIAAGVMELLERPPLDDFPSVGEWMRILPLDLQPQAQELIDSQGKLRLLHGDLHHDNLISCGASWRAIDPQGVVGELEFETAAFLRNPIGFAAQPDAGAQLLRRIDEFCERLQLERKRVVAWFKLQTQVSALWEVEDGGRLSLHGRAALELSQHLR